MAAGAARPAEGLVVAHIGPQPARAALASGEHRHGRVVGVDAFGREDVLADLIDQRHQRRRARADPVGQRRGVEIDAFVGIDVALPVERQMRPVLGEQDLGQELRSGAAARDRMRGRRRLRDGLAFAAGELLAHVLDHLPLRRHVLQRLGDVLAQLPQASHRNRDRRTVPDARRARAADAGQRPASGLEPLSALSATAVAAAPRSRPPPCPRPRLSSSSASCSSS